MSNFTYTSELYHHGVKGMKWGVRRTPEQLGNKISKKSEILKDKLRIHGMSNEELAEYIKQKRAESAKYKAARKEISNVKKNIHNMSDEELDTYLSRAKKESEAFRLVNESYKNVSRSESQAHSFVGQFMDSKGKQIVNSAVAGLIVYAGKKYLEKKFPGMMADMGGYVLPNPNKKK